MLGARQPAFSRQPVVQRGGGEGCDLTENRETRRPFADFGQGPLGDSRGVVIQAEDERRDGVDVAPGQRLEPPGVFARLIEALLDAGQIGRVQRLHADENPFAAGIGAIRSISSSSRSRLALICATQLISAPAPMIARRSDLVRFTLMAKLSSTKKTAILPLLARARSFSISISCTMLSLVRNRIESPKKPVTVQNSHPY